MPDGSYPIPRHETRQDRRDSAGLALKIRTRVKRRGLDEALAAGADPASSPELTLRAAQLRSQAARLRLADGLVKTLHGARAPMGYSLRLQPHRAEIRASADDLLTLALRLRDGRPAEIQGLALASLLLTPGKSPLDPDSGESLGQAVRSALAALGRVN